MSLKLQIQFTVEKLPLTSDFCQCIIDDINVYPKVFKLKQNSVSNSTHQE